MRRGNTRCIRAVCIACAWLAAGAGFAAPQEDDSRPRGRWIFRYDRSGEQPAMGRAQPNFLGTITEAIQTRARQWGMRLRIETLDGTQQSITVTESTRVDGRPAKQEAGRLIQGAPVAVFGEEERGAFRAISLFLIPEEDWKEIVAGARAAATEPQPTVPGRQWGQWAEEQEAEAGAFAWPARAWRPRYPIPEVAAPAAERRPYAVTPMERARRADFSGTIRGLRTGGRELSVATPGAVVVVLLDEQTIVHRDRESIAPSELREGDIVDVAVARWRGSESCTARELWLVTREEPPARLTGP